MSRYYPGNDLNVGTMLGTKQPLWLSRRDRARHLYVVGATRTGKTKFFEGLIRQDLLAWPTHRCPVVVLDPHGTLYDGLIAYAAASGLARWPIVPIDLRKDDLVVSYNLLHKREGADLGVTCKGFLDAMLHAWGQSNSNDTPRLATMLSTLLIAAAERNGTLIEAMQMIRDPQARALLAPEVEHFVAKSTFQSVQHLREREFQERVESTLYRINRFLSTQLMRAMLCQTGNTLDLSEVLEKGSILLVRLSPEGARVSDEDAATLGSILLTDLWLAARRRGKREEGALRPCYVYIDEFQNYVTPTIARGLSEASGYGLHLSLAHQYPSQLPDQDRDLGKMVLNSVLANAKNKVVFQLSHGDDLETLTSILYRQAVDPDQVKHEVWSTKVMGHQVQYMPSYSQGTTQGVSQGWERGEGISQSHTTGENWSHTDGTNHSHTTTDGVTETESESESDSEEFGTSHSEGTSRSRSTSNGISEGHSDSFARNDHVSEGKGTSVGTSQSESDSTSTSRSTSEGENWGNTSSRGKSGSASKGQSRSETYQFGPLNEPLQEELVRYRYTQMNPKEREAFRKTWPRTIEPMEVEEVDEFKRKWPKDYTLSEGESRSNGDGWSDASSNSSGGSRSRSESQGASHGTSRGQSQSQSRSRSRGQGQTRGASRSKGTSASSGITDGESEMSGISHSQGHSHTIGRSTSISHSESETHGTSSSDTYGGSEAQTQGTSQSWGENGSTSQSQSQGVSLSPMLMPIMGKELSSRQYRSVEEQLYRFTQILDGLPDRHCVVRLASMKTPAALFTATVKDAWTTLRWSLRWADRMARKLAFVLPMDVALKQLAERETLSLGGLGIELVEPADFRCPIPSKVHRSLPLPRRVRDADQGNEPS